MPSAIHFGAGNIGRGFIGALLSQAGYDVTFADIAEPLITALNEHHSYTLHITDVDIPEDQKKTVITNVSGIMSSRENEPQLLEALANADIVTTAVGPAVLRIISRSLAKAVTKRRLAEKGFLNIIACENMTGASGHLKQEVLNNLSSSEDKEYLEENIGFPNCAVDRIVPPFDASKAENCLSVGVEKFFEWIVEEPAIKGPKPEIPGMKFTDNLIAYVQRKLFTLNCGHATAAYLGFLKGFPTVDKALEDPWIEEIVHGAMGESGAALCKKHGFNLEEHELYIQKIMQRFRNPYIKDDVARVGRDPLRKLGPEDRLVGPTLMCKGFDLPHHNLLKGISAALCYSNREDPQCKQLEEKIREKGMFETVKEVTTFGEEDAREVVADREELLKLAKA